MKSFFSRWSLLGALAALFVFFAEIPGTAASLSLTGLKFHMPAGSSAELSSRSTWPSVEATVKSDDAKVGLDWIQARFSGPNGQSLYFNAGSDEYQPKSSATTVVKRTFTAANYLLTSYYLWEDYASSWAGGWRLEELNIYWWDGFGEGAEFRERSYSEGEIAELGLQTTFQISRWIQGQPSHMQALPASRLTLSVDLSEEAPFDVKFQWYRNGQAILGATQRTYTKNSVTEAADGGVYRVHLQSDEKRMTVQSDAAVVSIRTTNNAGARSAINQQNWTGAKTAIAKDASSKSAESLFVSAMAEVFHALGGPATLAVLTKAGMTPELAFPNKLPTLPEIFPANTNSTLANDLLAKTIVPALGKAESTLASITNTSFITFVDAGDIGLWNPDGTMDVMVFDYGDIQALRILLNAVIALGKIWENLDTNLRVDVVQTLYFEGKLSVQSLLGLSSKLLQNSASASAAKTAAFAALNKAASLYPGFSDFAFGGTSVPKRLFDDGSHFAEAAVRYDGITRMENLFLLDWSRLIQESVTSGAKTFPVKVTNDGSVSARVINLKALQTRGFALRGIIPAFQKNLVVGNAPSDPTFGGSLPWLTSSDAASAMEKLALNEPAITELLGTRDDQNAPQLILTDVPVNGKELLLGSEDYVVTLSGTVTDESFVKQVVMERDFGGQTETFYADLEELQDVYDPVTDKMIRTWRWTFRLDFTGSGNCSLRLYGVDQYNQKGKPSLVNFSVGRSVNVWVDVPLVNGKQGGTLTITPPIPESGMVKSGTKLKISASPKPGYLFRTLEVVVNGFPEDDISRPTLDLVVSADTGISAQFIENPFPALEGKWSGFIAEQQELDQNRPEWGVGNAFVTVNMTRTGAFSLKLVSGRNAFSTSGKMDASGVVRIVVPETFNALSGAYDFSRKVSDARGRTLNLFCNGLTGRVAVSWGEQQSVVGYNDSEPFKLVEILDLFKQTAMSAVPGIRGKYHIIGEYDAGGLLSMTLAAKGTAIVVGRFAFSGEMTSFSFSGALADPWPRRQPDDVGFSKAPFVDMYAVGTPTRYILQARLGFNWDSDSQSFRESQTEAPRYNIGYWDGDGMPTGDSSAVFRQVFSGPLDPVLSQKYNQSDKQAAGVGSLVSASRWYGRGAVFEPIKAGNSAPFSEVGASLTVEAAYRFFASAENSEERRIKLGALRWTGTKVEFERTSGDPAEITVNPATGTFRGSFSQMEGSVRKTRSFSGLLSTSRDGPGMGICNDGSRISLRYP
jgi:hypothetical protein